MIFTANTCQTSEQTQSQKRKKPQTPVTENQRPKKRQRIEQTTNSTTQQSQLITQPFLRRQDTYEVEMQPTIAIRS